MKPVKIQVRWAAAHPGQDRRLPGVVTHSRLQRVTARSWVGIVLEDGSGVTIDWVTGRSFSSAEKATRRSMYSQAYVRAGRCCGPSSSVAVRMGLKKVAPKEEPASDGKMIALGCTWMSATKRSRSPKITSALMDLCHLKNSKLEPKFKKYKSNLVF